ncbi:MAG TPA: hypothetical protein VF379_00550 [Gaiellaceae bacterium]
MDRNDRDGRNVLPPSTQTARALPTHAVRAGSTAAKAPSKTANVEGPIVPGTYVTQRFERNGEGELYERKVAAEIIVLLDAVVESKGYTAKIRVDVFDAIWARYDAGDYGSGRPGLGIYDDIAGLSTTWLVDEDVTKNPDRAPAATHGPQRIQLATSV